VTIAYGDRRVSFPVTVPELGAHHRDFQLPAETGGTRIRVGVRVREGSRSLPGADVVLARSDDGPTYRRTRQTGSDGFASFDGVPPGEYTLSGSAPTYARATVRIVVSTEPVEVPVLLLDPGAALRIEVRAAPGAAGSGEARVVVRPPGSDPDPGLPSPEYYYARVGIGEAVTIGGLQPATEYQVEVRADGYRPHESVVRSDPVASVPHVVTLVPE
jgi:hypothetical protein